MHGETLKFHYCVHKNKYWIHPELAESNPHVPNIYEVHFNSFYNTGWWLMVIIINLS